MSVIDKIKEQRQREIRKGENGFAAHPIYIVYSEGYTYGDPDEPDQSTTRFGIKERFVRVDSDGNEKAAEKNTDRWYEQTPKRSGGLWSVVRRVNVHDRFISFFFTHKAAKQFIKNDKHNLNKPRIFVEHAHRKNTELNDILTALGDKF